MSKNLPKSIGNLFKESIENLEQEPSARVWNKLAETLNSKPVNKKKIFNKRTLLLLLLLCLMTCTGIVYQYNKNIEKENHIEQLTETKQKEVNGIKKKVDKKIIIDLEQPEEVKKKERNTIEKETDTAIILKQAIAKKEIETLSIDKKVNNVIVIAKEADKNKNEKITTKKKCEKVNEIKTQKKPIEKKYFSTKENTDIGLVGNKKKENLSKNKKTKERNNIIKKDNNITYKKVQGNKAAIGEDKIIAKNNRSIFYRGKIKVSIQAPTVEENEEEIPKNKKLGVQEIAKISLETSYKKIITKDSIDKKENKNNTATSKTKKNSSLKNRFFITAFAAAEYANFIIEKNEEVTNVYDNSVKIKEREKETGSSTSGILFGYDITKKFAVELGFTYTMLNVETAATTVFAQTKDNGDIAYRYNTSIGYTYFKPSFVTNPMIGDSLKATEAEHSLEFMSVPLLFKYKIKIKKWNINPMAGVTFNFLTKSILETEIKNATNREKEIRAKFDGVKNISYSALLATEIQYNVYKKWSLVALPYLKYSLGSVNKNAIVETKPFFLGAGLGVSYKF
jgi:hypothetical protein